MTNDVYYFHNVKATVLFPVRIKEKIDWLKIAGNGFSLVKNERRFRFWGKNSYLPLMVLMNGKPWGEIDTQRQKLHINTRGNFMEQMCSFADLLRQHSSGFDIGELAIKYVEICTRYQDKHFDEVSKHIIETEKRFFTTPLDDSEDFRIKGKVWHSRGRNLLIDKNILNIKTYRFVTNFRGKNRTISDSILPKIEVQIYNPKSLEEAKQEAVPIIKAFQEHIGFETVTMVEPEYSLIREAHSLSYNEKLFHFFSNEKSVRAIKFPKNITKNETAYKVACYITPEAKGSQEIMKGLGIKRATLQRALKQLEPYLEKRGSKGLGIYYQIDTELIDKTSHANKDRKSCLTKNKGSVIGYTRESSPFVTNPDLTVKEQSLETEKVVNGKESD